MHVAGVFLTFQRFSLSIEDVKMMKMGLLELGICRWSGGGKKES